MAVVNGGDVVEMVISNDDAGTARLFGVAGEDSTFIKGGLKNEDNGAMDGGGRLLISKNRKPGSVEATFSSNMAASVPEFDFVQRVQASLKESVITVQLANDETWSGRGVVVGEPQLSGNKSTFTLKIVSGAGFNLQ